MQQAISRYMNHRKAVKTGKSRDSPVTHRGKQTLKQLTAQGQDITNIELTDPAIRQFERIARKYGVDYAIKKDRSESPPKYMIFFKARDTGAINAAFKEYTNKRVKDASRTSVLDKLRNIPTPGRDTPNKERRRERER